MDTNKNTHDTTTCGCWRCNDARALARIKEAAKAVTPSTNTIHVGGGSAPTRKSRRTA